MSDLKASNHESQVGEIHQQERSTDMPMNTLNQSNNESSFGQLHNQYMLGMEECLHELERIRSYKEESSAQIKNNILQKVNYMTEMVRKSFETIHIESDKRIEAKCQEIGPVLERVDKLLEIEGDSEVSREILKEKLRIEEQVEEVINVMNQKRQTDEQMLADFVEDIQQQVQNGILAIERSLEFDAEMQVNQVKKKIFDIRRCFANVQHFMSES